MNDSNPQIIARLSRQHLRFLEEHCPAVFAEIKNCDVLMWNDRVSHIEKHRFDFENADEFDEMVRLIPDIIENPDYIGYKEKHGSLQFIKRYDRNLLVAVRINPKGRLSFRTFYPISDSQLKDYIKKHTAWKFT